MSDSNVPKPSMEAAKGTYSGFIKWFKRGSIISAIVTVIVVLIIAS